MCAICHQTPCNYRCPNAEDRATVVCEHCGTKLYPGEDAYDIEGAVICDECLRDYCRDNYRFKIREV